MKSAFLWFVGFVVSGVLVNLLSSQIDAWLPILARRLVRRQAKRMGCRAERSAEEWEAHLDQTCGSLAKLWFALGTLLVPLRMRIERSCDEAGGLRQALRRWLHDQAWLITVPAMVMLLAAYPPDRSRYPAYGVLIPFLLLCALYLASPVRKLFARFFERCSYGGRVAVGSLVPVLLGYFVAAFGLIPPLDESPRQSPVASRTAQRPTVVIVPALPIDIDRQPPRASNSRTDAIVDRRPEPQQPLAKVRVDEFTQESRRVHGLLSQKSSALPFSPLPESLIVHGPQGLYPPDLLAPPAEISRVRGLESFDMTELLNLGPQQPLPSVQSLIRPPQVRGAPAAPVSLRIIQER